MIKEQKYHRILAVLCFFIKTLFTLFIESNHVNYVIRMHGPVLYSSPFIQQIIETFSNESDKYSKRITYPIV